MPDAIIETLDSLPGGERSRTRFFEGRAPVSLILADNDPGAHVRLHRHPYDELFVVHAGSAVFRIGEETVAVGAGHVLQVPAGVSHGFDVTGDEPFRSVNIHCHPTFETEWLET